MSKNVLGRKSRFPKIKKLEKIVQSAQKSEKNEAIFKQNYNQNLFIVFKMAYYFCFS